jgi:hypothetical protein
VTQESPKRLKFAKFLKGKFSRLPAPAAAALGFAAFICTALLLVPFMPPPRDIKAECAKQCAPRYGKVVADKNYPMSAKGTYRQVCECV